MWRIVLCCVLLYSALAVKLIMSTVRDDGPKCFFQSLIAGQKYFLSVSPQDHQKYRIDVMYQQQGTFISVVNKEAEYNNMVKISKFAQKQGTYMFCVSSFEELAFRFKLEIMTGLQLKNFDHLPSVNDNDNLSQEIEWISRQKNKIFQLINRVDDIQKSSSVLKEMMSTKLIVLAMVGLAGLIIINIVFFKQSRKVLKDRKLI